MVMHTASLFSLHDMRPCENLLENLTYCGFEILEGINVTRRFCSFVTLVDDDQDPMTEVWNGEVVEIFNSDKFDKRDFMIGMDKEHGSALKSIGIKKPADFSSSVYSIPCTFIKKELIDKSYKDYPEYFL